jgi:hypothetical protein
MPVTDKLPPLAVQALSVLRKTYDHHGPTAFDEDATKVFHVIGWIIAKVCGRERLVEAMEKLKSAVNMEGISEPNAGAKPSIH